MNVARALILLAALSLMSAPSPRSTRAAAHAPPRPAAAALDYEFFKTRVQPIFLAERPGHARCIACHGSGTPMRLQALTGGRNSWTEEESRKNFDVVRRMVVPGSAKSRLLMHTLAEQAGGDFYHNGGKHGPRRTTPVADGESLGDGRDGRRALQSASSDEQRRRQRPHHRSGDQHGRRRHQDRGRSRRRRHRTAAACRQRRGRARSIWSTRNPHRRREDSAERPRTAVSRGGRRVYVGSSRSRAAST